MGPYALVSTNIKTSRNAEVDTLARCVFAGHIDAGTGVGYVMPQPMVLVINQLLHALNIEEIRGEEGKEGPRHTLMRTVDVRSNSAACRPFRAQAVASMTDLQDTTHYRSKRNVHTDTRWTRRQPHRALRKVLSDHAMLFGLLLLFPYGAAPAADDTVISSLEVQYRQRIFQNAEFAAYHVAIPPGNATLMHRHDTDILSVFVSGGETRTMISGKPPRVETIPAGTVRFRPAGFTHASGNMGAQPFRFVVLEFKSSVGARLPDRPDDSRDCATDDARACVDQKYLLCTARLCARAVIIGPRAELRAGTGLNDQLLVAVSDFELSARDEQGTKMLARRSGEVEYLTGEAPRQWRNVATVPAHIVVVEFR